jgi:hypothetical protein
MAPLFIIGLICIIAGGIGAATNWKNMARRRRVLDTPTSRVCDAPGNQPVEIKGYIVPGEEGMIQTPFSGRPAVWARILVQEWRSTGRSGYWATLIDETEARTFYVDDQSGQRARIEPMGATIVVDSVNVANSGTFNDANPHIQAFVASRGLNTQSWLGFNKRMKFDEQALVPNSPLYAIGPSRRDAGYAGSQLAMFAFPGPLGELILTNKTEEQLVSGWMWKFVGSLVAVGFGALFLLAGVVTILLLAMD